MTNPSIPKTLDGIRDLYQDNLAEHGLTSKSVGWKDEASQLLRFERLARIITDRTKPFTVNDWGCGYGAMFTYLDTLGGANLAMYTGYDISPDMLSAATARCDGARSRFVLGPEVTGPADYTFVSGTFNVKLEATDAEWDAYVKRQLEIMFAQSTRGLAFNLLSSYVDWKVDQLFYADPKGFFDFCKTRLSRYVTLSHDYGLFEWTLLVTRDPQP